MNDFKNKYVIVTGAGQGIGYGLCEAFAQRGAIVALNDIDADLAQTAAQKINARHSVKSAFFLMQVIMQI